MLQQYKEYPHSRVIDDEYFYLCERNINGMNDYAAPHIQSLIAETWQTVELASLDKSIHHAVLRKEHEIYGISKGDFIHLAYKNKLPNFQPELASVDDIRRAVAIYLRERYICFTDFNGNVVNSPIGRDIW